MVPSQHTDEQQYRAQRNHHSQAGLERQASLLGTSDSTTEGYRDNHIYWLEVNNANSNVDDADLVSARRKPG